MKLISLESDFPAICDNLLRPEMIDRMSYNKFQRSLKLSFVHSSGAQYLIESINDCFRNFRELEQSDRFSISMTIELEGKTISYATNTVVPQIVSYEDQDFFAVNTDTKTSLVFTVSPMSMKFADAWWPNCGDFEYHFRGKNHEYHLSQN